VPTTKVVPYLLKKILSAGDCWEAEEYGCGTALQARGSFASGSRSSVHHHERYNILECRIQTPSRIKVWIKHRHKEGWVENPTSPRGGSERALIQESRNVVKAAGKARVLSQNELYSIGWGWHFRALKKRLALGEVAHPSRRGTPFEERHDLRGEARRLKRGTPFREIKDILLYISDKKDSR
jgi:hypothetical protein